MLMRVRGAGSALLIAAGPLVWAASTPGHVMPRGPTLVRDEPFPDFGTKCPGHGADSLPFQLVIPGEITNVPEYHDCQRFVRRHNLQPSSYDSLFAIFASQNAERLMDSLRALECGPQVKLSAVDTAPVLRTVRGNPSDPRLTYLGGGRDLPNATIVTPNFTRPTDCRAARNARHNSVGIAFAEIVSWGGTDARLGIAPNFNCLYLYDTAALKAFMRPVGHDEKKCLEPINPEVAVGTKLQVRAIHRAGLRREDAPPVARWDTDPQTGALYVGLYCDGKWCEVGRGVLTSSAQYVSESEDRIRRRVVEVKGWYDEQRLAQKGLDGKLVPSLVKGTMFPDPDLDGYTEDSFAPGVWLPAATVVISQAHDKYKSSLNLEPPGVPLGNTQIFLCREKTSDSARCLPAGETTPTCKMPDMNPTEKWFSRIVSGSGDVRYRCVHRYAHPGLHRPIPGTVRWAWFEDDEGGWIRCPAGCCYPN